MPAIHTILASKDAEGKPFFSIEFFPPKTEDGVAKLVERFPRYAAQGPVFADVTWGAGGSTSDTTMSLCKKVQEAGIIPNMHLTCTNMPEEKIKQALSFSLETGQPNIVALRGDPPAGEKHWTAVEGGFSCALDLIRYIRASEGGSTYSIATAGYPEGHINAIKKIPEGTVLTESERRRSITLEDGEHVCFDADYASEIAYLKQKVDAGANYIITQMFFDVEVFLQFGRDCRAAGIMVPILPGLMLVQNYGGFKRMVAMCKTRVPAYILASLEAVKDDDEKVRLVGASIGAGMSKAILAGGFLGLHFYVLNQEEVFYSVLKELGLYKTSTPSASNAASASASSSS